MEQGLGAEKIDVRHNVQRSAEQGRHEVATHLECVSVEFCASKHHRGHEAGTQEKQ